MSEHLKIREYGDVLSITLARPEHRNALTVDMYAGLADEIEGATGGSVRLITIEGDGQDFAAGNDLADFLNVPPGHRADIPVWRFLRALAQCEIPIVAAVHGNCVGIGTTMLLHCDLVIADETARFSLPFVDLALVPEAASTLLLPQLAGRRRAARYLLLGEPFGADEALAIGLASHVVPEGRLDEELERIVKVLTAKPLQALQQTQRLLREDIWPDVLERMRLERTAFAERLASPEVKEAISAFFEKRKPDFSRFQ